MGIPRPYRDALSALGELPDCVGHFAPAHDQCIQCGWRQHCAVYQAVAMKRAKEMGGIDYALVVESDRRNMPRWTFVRMLTDIAQVKLSAEPTLDPRHATGWRRFISALEEEIGSAVFSARHAARVGDLFWRATKPVRGIPTRYTLVVKGVSGKTAPKGDTSILRYIVGWNAKLAEPTIEMRLEVMTVLGAFPQLEWVAHRWSGRLIRQAKTVKLLGATAVKVRYECIDDIARAFGRLLISDMVPGVHPIGGSLKVTEEAISWRRWAKFGKGFGAGKAKSQKERP